MIYNILRYLFITLIYCPNSIKEAYEAERKQALLDCENGKHNFGLWDSHYEASLFQHRYCKVCNLKQEEYIV